MTKETYLDQEEVHRRAEELLDNIGKPRRQNWLAFAGVCLSILEKEVVASNGLSPSKFDTLKKQVDVFKNRDTTIDEKMASVAEFRKELKSAQKNEFDYLTYIFGLNPVKPKKDSEVGKEIRKHLGMLM